MTYITRGTGLGHIEVNLRKLGVKPEDEPSLLRTVKTMRMVDPSTVIINNGLLKCTVHRVHATGAKGQKTIEKIHDSIVRSATHKGQNPGRGVDRSSAKKQKFINDPAKTGR